MSRGQREYSVQEFAGKEVSNCIVCTGKPELFILAKRCVTRPTMKLKGEMREV